jgi:hypothetical protein
VRRIGSRTAELEAKYGTDEALGITYREPYPGHEPMSVLPNNKSASICTNCADEIRRREPNSVVVGWPDGANPSAQVNDPAFGHDFAIVDDRYLVDHWAKNTWGTSTRAVYDLQDAADVPEIRRLYGDPTTWEHSGATEHSDANVKRALQVACAAAAGGGSCLSTLSLVW